MPTKCVIHCVYVCATDPIGPHRSTGKLQSPTLDLKQFRLENKALHPHHCRTEELLLVMLSRPFSLFFAKRNRITTFPCFQQFWLTKQERERELLLSFKVKPQPLQAILCAPRNLSFWKNKKLPKKRLEGALRGSSGYLSHPLVQLTKGLERQLIETKKLGNGFAMDHLKGK